MTHLLRRVPLLVLVVLVVCFGGCASAPSDRSAEPAPRATTTTIHLIRHADKRATGGDPELSVAGLARAADWRDHFASTALDRIWTTEYRRTRQTAEAIGHDRGVPIDVYDPSGLEAFAADLRRAGGTVLVVGHSDTTPRLAALLGNESVAPIAENEYDRVITVTLLANGLVRVRDERLTRTSRPE